jgi:MSHA pilin protein MshD
MSRARESIVRAKAGTQRGVTLVELIVFIVVVGTAAMGVLLAIDVAARSSADPMIQKQALAVAESLLEEAQLQPFTYCDPDDPNAAAARSAADCTGGANGPNDENRLVAGQLGPEGGETRTSATTPFDNASDYNGLVIGPGITDITGAAIPGLGAFTATIAVANQALGAVPASDSLLITVTVSGPGDTTVVLQGYRVRYAPNALP